MKNVMNVFTSSTMDDLVSDDITALAICLATVGIPTKDKTKRIFFPDIDSCIQFAKLYKAMFYQGKLSQEDVDEVIGVLKNGIKGFGIKPVIFEVDEDAEYISYPQFLHGTLKAKEEQPQQMTLNMFLA